MKFRVGYVPPSGGRAPYRATLAAVSVNCCLNRCSANSNPIKEDGTLKINLCRAGGMLATMFLATSMGFAGGGGRNTFVLTSTNNANGNEVVVFELNTAGTPSLFKSFSFVQKGQGPLCPAWIVCQQIFPSISPQISFPYWLI